MFSVKQKQRPSPTSATIGTPTPRTTTANVDGGNIDVKEDDTDIEPSVASNSQSQQQQALTHFPPPTSSSKRGKEIFLSPQRNIQFLSWVISGSSSYSNCSFGRVHRLLKKANYAQRVGAGATRFLPKCYELLPCTDSFS